MPFNNVNLIDQRLIWYKSESTYQLIWELYGCRDLPSALIADYQWFNQCEELPAWLQDHGVKQLGMTLIFPDQATADWFTMRWL